MQNALWATVTKMTEETIGPCKEAMKLAMVQARTQALPTSPHQLTAILSKYGLE